MNRAELEKWFRSNLKDLIQIRLEAGNGEGHKTIKTIKFRTKDGKKGALSLNLIGTGSSVFGMKNARGKADDEGVEVDLG